MIIGTLIYIGLEIAFIGALNPLNLIHGWGNPIGPGDYGPYATLATGLGIGWLATLLYIPSLAVALLNEPGENRRLLRRPN